MRKLAFITGASRGIGEAIAREFAASGYDLSLCCKTNIEELEKLAAELENLYGIRILTHQVDVSNAKAVAEAIEKTQVELGEIQVLVNNAGISKVGLLQDMTEEEWNEIVGVNLSSVFYACKAVIPQMVNNKKGHIINLSSVWGNAGASCEVAYSATKGGMNAFTKALAKELAPSNIAVNAIACGAVDTSMNAHLDEEDKRALAEEIPFGRFASPREIAECVLKLAEMPAYLTGQVITVDGGWQ